MSDAVTAWLTLTGDSDSLAALARQHLPNGNFDFNTVQPMPPELEIESSSMVETGYAALYGDWQTETGRWMFKEPAQAFGFPFPLASRRPRPITTTMQLQRHGHGDWYGWCNEHWGTKWNAEEVRVRIEPDCLHLSFLTANTFPKPIAKALSLAFPSISFHIRCVDEHGRWAKDHRLLKGKESQKLKRSLKEVADEIAAFRKSVA
jgi:hypothetical protein